MTGRIKNKNGYYFMYYYMQRAKYLYFFKYHFYWNLLLDFIKELLLFPVKIRWATRVADIRLIKYYYLGIVHGLMKKQEKLILSSNKENKVLLFIATTSPFAYGGHAKNLLNLIKFMNPYFKQSDYQVSVFSFGIFETFASSAEDDGVLSGIKIYILKQDFPKLKHLIKLWSLRITCSKCLK